MYAICGQVESSLRRESMYPIPSVLKFPDWDSNRLLPLSNSSQFSLISACTSATGKGGVLQKSAFFSMNSNGIICFVDNNRNNVSISLPKLSSSTYDELSEQNQTMPLCRQYLATGYGKPQVQQINHEVPICLLDPLTLDKKLN